MDAYQSLNKDLQTQQLNEKIERFKKEYDLLIQKLENKEIDDQKAKLLQFMYVSLFSVTIPLTTALITLSFLVAAIYYYDRNKAKQLDNRYKLLHFDTHINYEMFKICPDKLYITEEQLTAFNLPVR